MLKLAQVNVVYPHKKKPVYALHGIDFHLVENEFVVITGPSGSGKTTFVQVCGGMLTPDQGVVEFMGQRIDTMDDDALSLIRNRYIGYVFQFFNLIEYLTAVENVALPLVFSGFSKAERIKKASELLDAVGLSDRTKHFPSELSGGECQRVAIARALIMNPAFLIADEPTGNLDLYARKTVMDILMEIRLQRDISILLVTHDPEVASYGDRVIQMTKGELV